MLQTPVLFLVFNRPNTTKQVFEAIRQAKPAKLYVAADGPRLEKEGESIRVREVREIATAVDWNCKVTTLFRDKNLGCKMAVSRAITWFFENEEEGIILEDDCLPDQSFFTFCKELLLKYRDDNRVMMISGDNFQDGQRRTKYSYYFTRYPHVWGWATWKRAWRYWDGELHNWPEVRDCGLLQDVFNGDIQQAEYWAIIFEKMFNQKIDTWDYPLVYAFLCQNGLCIAPNVNLVSNIGFGDGATHTHDPKSSTSNIPAHEITFPLQHPTVLIRNCSADKYVENDHFKISSNKKKSMIRSAINLFRDFRGGPKN